MVEFLKSFPKLDFKFNKEGYSVIWYPENYFE